MQVVSILSAYTLTLKLLWILVEGEGGGGKGGGEDWGARGLGGGGGRKGGGGLGGEGIGGGGEGGSCICNRDRCKTHSAVRQGRQGRSHFCKFAIPERAVAKILDAVNKSFPEVRVHEVVLSLPGSIKAGNNVAFFTHFWKYLLDLPGTVLAKVFLSSRVSDPDPDWIRIQSGQWIRIGIRNPDPDPGGQKWPTKVEIFF